jgi:adenosylmethionine-8-amino-7-oxononanoate aminotransferase
MTTTTFSPGPSRAPPHPLAERDLRVVWHPCTQMKDHEWLPMLPIERGEGVWLYGHDGRRYLDAISSWWVNLFGHANPRINAGITAQLGRLEHVLLAGFTHEPAVTLAERLTRLAPPGLTRCFYADNGSSAIEVALKMSFHYWRNRGHDRKRRFITLANSYHGETLGALAVGHVELYKEIYQPLLMRDVITAPTPDAYEAGPGETAEDCARRAIAAMAELLERHAAETCAVIVEPVVQCAAGMRMHSPLYVTLLRELCDRHEVHLIADEIAVGFGRTGTMFACEQAAVTPDFLCLSKGITGGYLPLSVVLAGEDVYEAFYDEYVQLRAFLHSHSYTGNALACSAALATLDIFESDAVIERNRVLAAHLGRRARELLGELPHVAEVRQAGMVVAAELAPNGNRRAPFDWRERRGLHVYRHGLEHEALLRPIGNVVYFMPPYVITPEQIDTLVATARDGIAKATADCPVPRARTATASPAVVPAASTTGLEF